MPYINLVNHVVEKCIEKVLTDGANCRLSLYDSSSALRSVQCSQFIQQRHERGDIKSVTKQEATKCVGFLKVVEPE